MTTKFNRLLALLLLSAAFGTAGCGEPERTNFRDPSDVPPLSASASAAIQSEDQAVADAEKAVSASYGTSKGKSK